MTTKRLLSYDFCYRLSVGVLRIISPCRHCSGSGFGPMAPDFLGDDPKTMTIGTVSACEYCDGTGVDPQTLEAIANSEVS